jgi:TonB-linked SusC/RagA family outer membrane protein
MKKLSKTTIFLMRSTFFIALTICLCNVLLIASPGSAQKLKETKISISFNGESLDQCIKEIELKSSLQFAFNPAELKVVKAGNLNFKNKSVQDVLAKLLKRTNLSVTEYGEKVVIYNNLVTDGALPSTSSLNLPPIVVSGKILNEKGEAVPSVTVTIKGSNKSVISNELGLFSIEADDNSILVFSSIGYSSTEIAVDKKSSLAVTLSSISNTLEDVVVIGYGTQKRKDVTGAIASLKGEVLKNLPVRGVSEALQGRVAGVFVSSEGGDPSASSNIIIRGPVNIRGAGPLYVVDGIPFTDPGNSFNMQDVENIEVIKDAGAAAIYGSRAAGGVIIVTTKKGKAGKLLVAANASIGSRKALNLPQLLSKDDFIKARIANGDNANSYFGPESGRAALPNTNWFDYLFRTSTEQNYTVSLAGGNDKSTYFMSANYNDQQGVRIDNFVKRYAIRINSDHKINSHLKVGETFYLTSQNENGTHPANQGILNYRSSPIMSVFDATNPLGGWGKTPDYFKGGNDYGQEMSNYDRYNGYEANLAVYGELEIIKGLKIRQNLAMRYSANDNYYYNYPYDWGSSQKTYPTFGKGYGKGLDFIGNTTINYLKKIGKHDFSLLAGYEALKAKSDNINGYADYPNAVLNRDFSFTSQQTIASNRLTGSGDPDFIYRVNSMFGRLTYSYDNKYLLNANIRRDGVSTAFGPNNKYGIFPSVSVGWKVINEDFLKGSNLFSDLKLRASYGLLGNSDVPNFLFQTSYNRGYPAVLGANGPILNSFNINTQMANKDIQWEDVTTTNIGADIAFFKNKLTLSVDVYSRQTKKMVYDVPVAGSAGQGESLPFNIGQMSNKGIEFLVNYKGDIIKDLSFNVGVNGAFNTNKLITLDPKIGGQFFDGDLNEIYGGSTVTKTEPGQPLGQFYGWVAEGIYQSDADGAKGAKVQGDALYTPRAGDLIYKDLNADGKINEEDRTYIGNPWPKLNYGVTLGMQYKGLDLAVLFTGIMGVDIYNGQESFNNVFFGDYNTTADIFKTSFFNSNAVTDVPRSYYPQGTADVGGKDPNGNWSKVSSYHVKNGSFIKLRNIQLGYTLPNNIAKIAGISTARLFVMADNLFTITKYKGYDPEIAGDVRARGIDNSNLRYPTTRYFSIGLNVNF